MERLASIIARDRQFCGDGQIVARQVAASTRRPCFKRMPLGSTLENCSAPRALPFPRDERMLSASRMAHPRCHAHPPGTCNPSALRNTAEIDAFDAALLRPAALAQGVYPLGSIAKLPREPQNKTPDRQNGDLPRHEKQENHPRRLMHEAAPLLSLGDIATENQCRTVTRFKKTRSVAKISQVSFQDARTEHRHTGQIHRRTAGTVAASWASVRANQNKREQTYFSMR